MTLQRVRGGRRAAFTLLEVLVACGILVVALASIAAILPAAASRLGDATASDRAATMTSLVFSDLRSRGFANRNLFPNPTSAAGVVFGDGLSTSVMTTVTNSGYPGLALFSGTLTAPSGSNSLLRNSVPILTLANAASLGGVVDVNRGFILEDDVTYLSGTTGPTPVNLFGGLTATTGFRMFAPGVCWGAVLTPEPWGTASGSATAVRASIAVFRRPSIAIAMTLREQGPGLFVTGTWPGAVQRLRLKPCTAVLALPLSNVAGQSAPQWLRIRSAWTSGSNSLIALGALTSGSAPASVIFDRPPPPGMVSASGSLTVLTFDGLLSTDQRILPIQ